jgi:L,D-peptidoglycan transpeptidase YkuD (ErfK/YbiS/YcfS/YnhG family)
MNHYVKKEGDGKSSMGIFALGFAFGEHSLDVFSKPLKFPYRQMQSYHHCVNDRNSDY